MVSISRSMPTTRAPSGSMKSMVSWSAVTRWMSAPAPRSMWWAGGR